MMNFQKDAHINIYTSRKLSAKWAMSTKKQLEWTFLLVFFQGSKFFLVSFLKIHVVEEKGGLNRVVDLKLKWIKNNPNIVKCSNIRKYNCSKIITFCCNTRQDINKEMKKNGPKIQTYVITSIHLHLSAHLASVWQGCIMTAVEKFGAQALQLSFMTSYFTRLLGGAINIREILPCCIAWQN